MKKVLSLILALAMVFALVACGEKLPASDGDASSDGDKPARGNVIMTFGTADTGGSMYPAGAAVSQVWTNNVEGVKCNTQTSTAALYHRRLQGKLEEQVRQRRLRMHTFVREEANILLLPMGEVTSFSRCFQNINTPEDYRRCL